MSSTDGLTTCSQCGQRFPSTVRLCPNDGTVLEHQSATATGVGQVLDGKYRLDTLLAEGGMGAVYSATHVMLGKKIAIKLIRPELGTSPEIVRRFQREARAATALNHPNIVSVYDLGQTPNGTLYIAMEFIDGPSLKTVIQAARAIAPMRTISILRQVASALAVAHKHNIIHRDLKPHNIMLATGADGSEQAKLVDFGIAKTFDEATQLTSMGSALGTPYYMSPEQIEGRTVDARSDLYALGIIFYEMLVGEVPFSDQSTPAVLVKQLKDRPTRPSLRNPAVPASLETIALRCLEKDPNDRYQTADQFAAALDEAAASMNEIAGQATVPMATVPMARQGNGQDEAMLAAPKAAATAAVPAAPPSPVTATPPASAAPSLAAPAVNPPPSEKTPMGTRPTVPMPQMPPAASAAPADVAARKSSMGFLIAIAAVLVLLAGGYLVWSGRQTASPTAQTTPTDAPKATPAMAGQEPPSPAAVSTSAAGPTADPAPGAPASAPPAPSASADQAAGTAAATKEALATKLPAATAAPAAVKGATQQATNAVKAGGAAPSGLQTAAPSAPPARQPAATAAAAAAPSIPDNAAVLFRCSGAPDVCASLRTQVNDALDKAGFRVVTAPDRADIAIGAVAGGLQEKVTQQFGQTFATRTYQIELSGEAPKLGDMVPMPPATTVTFDPAVGRERLEEKSRLVAADVVERLRAFIKKRGA